MIYLDYAATTPIDKRAIASMESCMLDAWQNPSAAYASAGNARRRLRLARRSIAAMLDAQPNEIVFTSGGTESNNLALSIARGKHAVISAVEHASVLQAAKSMDCDITFIPPDRACRVRPEAVEAAIRADTALISVQFANNETGALQPVGEIGEIARQRRIPFHCDAVQAFGHVPVNVRENKIDLLSVSAHKFYGPRGAGALYVRQGIIPPPIISGGGQEFGLRAGTENVPAICGMAAAAELAREDMAARAECEDLLMDFFAREICARIPECAALCGDAARLPGVRAFLLPGLPSERAIAELDVRGIQVSGGAACASRGDGVSHVYRAMGLSEEQARCVIRISIGRGIGREDMARAADAISQVYRLGAD